MSDNNAYNNQQPCTKVSVLGQELRHLNLTGGIADLDARLNRIADKIDKALADSEAEIEMLLTDIAELEAAGTALYMAGRWELKADVPDQHLLWESLRDALGLPQGTATQAELKAQIKNMGGGLG